MGDGLTAEFRGLILAYTGLPMLALTQPGNIKAL